MAAARTTYSALNCQLVAELPQLIQLAGGVLGQAVHQLAVARKLYVGNCTRELLAVMEVRYSVQAISGVLVFVLKSLCLLTDHKSCVINNAIHAPQDLIKNQMNKERAISIHLLWPMQHHICIQEYCAQLF